MTYLPQDLAPLLPPTEPRTPGLPRISEHTEEPSGSTIRSPTQLVQLSKNHTSRPAAPSSQQPGKYNEPRNDPVSPTLSSSYDHSQPPVTCSSPQMSTDREPAFVEASASSAEIAFQDDNKHEVGNLPTSSGRLPLRRIGCHLSSPSWIWRPQMSLPLIQIQCK